MKHLMTTMTAVAACALGAPAGADMVDFVSNGAASTEGLGSYVGSLEWTWDGSSSFGTLDVELTNTSNADNGGFITAFAFQPLYETADSMALASAELTTTNYASFLNFDSPQGVSPFPGPYVAGAGIGGTFLGGGNPNPGIAVGDTGLFSFTVTADDLAAISAATFLGTLEDHPFLVRFRGFDDGGSDKVPAMIPGAASIALFGFGGLVRRRRG